MNILIVKSIFIPTESHLKVCTDSIINLFNKLNLIKVNNQIKYTVIIIGWCKKKEYKKNIKILIKNYNNFKIVYMLWVINYGKLKILNYCFDYAKLNNFNGMLYFDHDILFDLDKHYNFDEIFELSNNLKLGLISFNQLCDCRHQSTIYENTKIVKINNIKINIVYPNKKYISSIASGAFYISIDAIITLNQLPLISVYTCDDHIITTLLFKNGFTSVVLKDYYIIHPYDIHDTEMKYKEWKHKMIMNYINDKNNYNIDLYFNTIQDSINFWNSE
jgi:hypothetical protein